jgi:hypothetical protein
MSDRSRTMVVAVEYGAEPPCNLQPQAGVDLVAVFQAVGEEPMVFARRFLGKITLLLGNGIDVVSAALAVSSIFDLCHLEAPCVIVRTILRAFRSGCKGQLLLVEPIDATPECRRHLAAIVEGLLEGAATDSQIGIACDVSDSSSTTGAGARRYQSRSTMTALERS